MRLAQSTTMKRSRSETQYHHTDAHHHKRSMEVELQACKLACSKLTDIVQSSPPALVLASRLTSDAVASTSHGTRGGTFGSISFHMLDNIHPVVVKQAKMHGSAVTYKENQRSIINEMSTHLHVGNSPHIAALRGTVFDPSGFYKSALVIDRWDDDMFRFIKAFHDDVPHLRKLRMSVGSSGYFFATLQILNCVARGLKTMHDAGYIHGDLSIANVLWRQTPYFFFGALGDLGRSLPESVYDEHDVDVYYWPPVGELEPTRTRKMDIFSFGIIIYCVALGKVHLNNEAKYKMHLSSTSPVYQNSKDVRGGSKGALLELAWKCVQATPSERPTAGELSVAIESMMV